jgi:protein-disulfide isomerase
MFKRVLAVGVLGVIIALAPAAGATEQSPAVGQFTPEQRRDFEAFIREYLLEHPEVIAEAIQKLQAQQQQAEDEKARNAARLVKPVTSEDHIVGDRNAPVKIIEFSDFECPYCKQFHRTLKQLMREAGKSGDVAWVYRHFPIDQLHPKARKEAQAAECANELGGNNAFWAYADRIFEITPSNNGLDLSLLPQIAQDVGLDRSKFEACLAGDARGGRYATHIQANVSDAETSGGNGTPYTVVMTQGGAVVPVIGAQPYESLKAILEAARRK